jgi:hypothetical protein
VIVQDRMTSSLVGDVSSLGLLQLTGLFLTERVNNKVVDNKVAMATCYKGCTYAN